MSEHTGGANDTAGAGDVGGTDGGLFGWLATLESWLSAPEHVLFVRLVGSVFLVLGFILVGRLAKRALDRSALRTAEKQGLDPWKTRALISRTRPLSLLVHIGLFVSVLIIALYLWGLRTAFVSLLTAAGVFSIVIGLAAANTLSNLIAGFVIFYNHPFDIGDWVEIEGHQGLVIDVKTGATIMETWDGEKVTFPNRVVEGALVKNFSHQRKLRRRFRVGIDYATDIAKARKLLVEIVQAHPEVLKEPEPMVVGLGFGESSIDLELRYWIAPLRARVPLIETWLMQEVQRAFAREGIVIPFPQRTLVHRYPQGDAPEGQTVSALAYDPATDTAPFPAPPLEPPIDFSSPHSRQARSPLWWFQRGKEGGTDDGTDRPDETDAPPSTTPSRAREST